ncbi:MAG: DUF4271 domain-containing protein [Bacteroidota bacterium]|nr:DUF4271 domain-containing protein [Bacteroidota bacterium]
MQQDSLPINLRAPWENIRPTKTDTSVDVSNFVSGQDSAKQLSTQQSFAEKPSPHFEGTARPQESLNWVTLLLLGVLLLYAMVQFLNYQRLGKLFVSFISRSQARQLIKEGNLFGKGFTVPLQILAISSISLFLYYFLNMLSLNEFFEAGFRGYAMIFLAITVLWFLKVLAIYTSGFLLKTEESSREYSINMLIYFIICGLLLTPVLILGIYTNKDIILYGGSMLWLIIFFLWIIRALSIGMHERNFSILHLFLYLCTFEILPVIVLSKIILEAK